MKGKLIYQITKIITDILFYTGIIGVVSVVWWSKVICDFLGYARNEHYIILAMLMSSGIIAVYILFNIKGMLKTVLNDNPFDRKNVSAFFKVAISCIVIALIYLVKCFVSFSFATLVIVVIFAVAALFCLTLKELFNQAVYYKEENDWTV